jgi:hypothetical protein
MPTNTTGRTLLTGVVLELTFATALIHLTLGGTLFTLNAVGYAVLGTAYLLASLAPQQVPRRLRWAPAVALAGFASVTIAAYLIVGPHFMLGWVTKGIELAIVGLVVAAMALDTDGDRPGRPNQTRAWR